MRALVATLVVAAIAAPLGSAAAPVDASSTVVVTASDPRKDAKITRDPGLSTSQRRSIDVRRLELSDRGNAIRFTMTVKRLDRSRRFTQIYIFHITTAELPYNELLVATHSLSEPASKDGLEHRMTVEGADAPQGYVGCTRLPFSLRNGASTWWIEVPKRCLPEGPAELDLYTQTVQGPDIEPFEYRQYSHDRLVVSGSFDLGGTVQAAS
jgi:hypothetical protein